MAKSEVTTEEVTAIGTAPAALSAVFKENAEVVVAQASATDTSESAPQFLDPGAESSAETPAAAESTETAETTEAAFGTPTEGATGAIEGEGLLKEGEEGLLEGALAAPGGAGAGALGATGLGGATTDPFAAAMGAVMMGGPAMGGGMAGGMGGGMEGMMGGMGGGMPGMGGGMPMM